MYKFISISQKKIALFILLCFLTNFQLLSQKSAEVFKLEFDKNYIQNLPITRLNDREYFNLTKHYQRLFLNGKFDNETGKIVLKNSILWVTQLSFFIVKDSADKRQIYQMNMPVLSIKGEFLVPLKPFLQALNYFGMYLINVINERHIKISQLDVEPAPIIKPIDKTSNKKKKKIGKLEQSAAKENHSRHQKSYDEAIQIKPDTSKPDFRPNQYILPPELYRKKINSPPENQKRLDTSIQINDIIDSNSISPSSDLYASIVYWAGSNNTRIITFDYSQKQDNCIDITLRADNTITTYHKPEIKEGKLILRIPDVINDIKNLSNINIPNFHSGIEVEYIRNFLLYKLNPLFEIDSLASRRNGLKEIIYTIVFRNDSKSIPQRSKIESELPQLDDKWKLDVIVIDPGHGGEDPGAISINGYREKDLALAIALELRKLIRDNLPEIQVVMTREDDRFVELYKRGSIANQANGKLFVSIHLNSMPKKPHNGNGFETYILRPGRNEDAIRVAERENSVIKFEKDQSKYQNLDDESLILATLAQSGFQKLSELFAKIIQSEVAKTTSMKNRGVNQAGFYVLVGASMPNVLFEGGFLSNKEDEKFITSKEGQKKIALGLFNAIKRYVSEYQSLIHSENR